MISVDATPAALEWLERSQPMVMNGRVKLQLVGLVIKLTHLIQKDDTKTNIKLCDGKSVG